MDLAAMNFGNIVRESTTILRHNAIRTILTILGISVGVGAFICVVEISNAGSSVIEKQLQNLGDNFIWIEAGSCSRNGIRYGARGDRTLTLSDATAIVQQVLLIKGMSPNVDGHIQVIYAGAELGNHISRCHAGVCANSLVESSLGSVLYPG